MPDLNPIRELIGQARIEEAIEKLLQLNTRYKNSIFSLKGSYAKLKDQELSGVIDPSQAEVKFNKIVNALLSYISQIEEELAKTVPEQEARKWKILTI